MTLALPVKSVDFSGISKPLLSSRDRRQLAKIEDETVREVLAKLMASTDGAQQNFQRIQGQFPNVIAEGGSVQNEAITGDNIQADAITAVKIAAGSIETDKLAAEAVTAEKIEANTITGNEIAADALDAHTITGATIRTAESGARVILNSTDGIKGINASEEEQFHFDLASGILTATAVISSLTGSQIDTEHLAGQITETQIEDDAISTPKLQANSVEAGNIAVANLAAINADLGSITAGTLTGPLFRTSSSGARTQIDSTEGFRQFDTDGTTVLTHIPADGSTAEFSGHISAAGVDLETDSTFSPNKAVSWLDGEDSHGNIWTSVAGSTSILSLECERPSGVLTASHIRIANAALGSTVEARASDGDSSEAAVIIGSGGASSFLQLTSTAERKFNAGSDTCAWPGGNIASSATTVTHGLGTTPTSVVACITDFHGSTAEVDEIGATTFKVRLVTVNGAAPSGGTSRPFNWMAFG